MLSPSIEALTIGNWRSASTITLAMNAVKVSFAPAASNSAFFFSRSALTREVHLVDRVDVRRGVRAQHHVLGDLPAHHAHRHDRDVLAGPIGRAAAGVGRAPCRSPRTGAGGGAARLDVAEDVLLGHAAADAGALDLGDVDVVLVRDPAHQRRRLLPAQIVRRRRLWRVRFVVRPRAESAAGA